VGELNYVTEGIVHFDKIKLTVGNLLVMFYLRQTSSTIVLPPLEISLKGAGIQVNRVEGSSSSLTATKNAASEAAFFIWGIPHQAQLECGIPQIKNGSDRRSRRHFSLQGRPVRDQRN